MHRFIALYILFLGLILSGCSKIPPINDGSVDSLVASRIGSQTEWRLGNDQEEAVQSSIQWMISHELTADTAIQIALLNNPQVQAIFEELGIARADLIEAGLLSNPSFEIELRYPHTSGLKTNIEYLITSSLLDIFLIPLRTKLARTEYEQTKLRVSNEILELAFEVRATFYELVTEKKKIQYLLSVADLISIMTEISAKQIAIGNIYSLDYQLAQSRLLNAELELSQSQAEIIRLKEKLNKLLGFCQDKRLIFPANLPDIDCCGLDLGNLESIALEGRLDLQVARFEIARLCQMLGLKEGWTYTLLKGGLAGEREPDGANLLGPGFSGEIPLFNYGQAARIRLFAQLRQAKELLAQLEIKAVSEVREAHQLLLNYMEMIDAYQNHLLPMQAKISASSEELYNVMGLGIDQLLEKKRQELVAHQNYTESLKKYLLARVNLDRALGGNLFQMHYRQGATH